MRTERARAFLYGKVTLRRGKLMGYEAATKTLLRSKNRKKGLQWAMVYDNWGGSE